MAEFNSKSTQNQHGNYELELCPFCGGKAHTKTIHSKTNKMFRKLVNIYYYVKCFTCGCSTGVKATKIEAEEIWNTRTQQKEGEAMLEMTPEWVIANYENYIKDGCNNIEKELLDLAKRQKAEIERLARENIGLKYDLQVASEESLTVQSESVKRFAETVKTGFRPSIRYNFSVWIDSLLKNWVGDNK